MTHHWFGNTETKWPVVPIREVADLGTGHTPARDVADYWQECTIPWVTVPDIRAHGTGSLAPLMETEQHINELGLANSAAVLHPAGTVMLSRTASIGYSCVIGRPMATTQAFVTWTPRDARIDSDYLHAALKAMSEQYHYLAYGATHLTIYFPDIQTLRVPLPPIDEQRLIAVFLDLETAKIDALVEEQRRLIELLKVKRQAVISHAVTKGLNPDAPMKDSGVEWLGEVPEHWDVVPLMRLTPEDRKIMYGIVLPGPHVEDGVPIVKGGDVVPHRLNPDTLSRTTHEIESKYVRSRLRGGDIVYAIRGSIGEAGIVPDCLEDANLTQDAARVSPLPGIDVKWLFFAVQSAPVFAQLEQTVNGATIRGINIFELKRARIPVPPNGEREEIAEYLSDQLDELCQLQSKAEHGIEVLKERRTALISAAVTGKIDIRNHAPTSKGIPA